MKKLLAVLMALVMLITGMSLGAFAKAEVTPVIIVSGVGARPFYMDMGTENEKTVYPPQVDFPTVIAHGVFGIALTLVTGDVSIFSKTASYIVSDIFEEFKCDENGNSKYNVSPITYPLSIDNYEFDYANDVSEIQIAFAVSREVGEENTYFYNYDWRLDPCSNANGLDKMIENVKSATGSDKVVLVPCSMGGVQTIAYLEKFGSDDIESIIFMSAAHRGLYFVSEMFIGGVTLNQKDLFTFLSKLITVPDENADNLVSLVFDDLGQAAMLSSTFLWLDSFLQQVSDDNLWSALREIFGRLPGMWAFVRPEYFDEAVSFMTDENTGDDLIEKITYYNKNVSAKNDEILTEAKENGVKISICSHYDKGSIPVTAKANVEGDDLIETPCTSNGATVALSGEVLGADYVQAVNCGHNHISVDDKIDASTCLFPESTWFIKGQPHVGVFCDENGVFNDYADFVAWLATSDTQPTVFANPGYPQFMEADASLKELNPLVAEAETDYATEIIALLGTAVDYIKNNI